MQLKDLFDKDKLGNIYTEYLSENLKSIDPNNVPDNQKKIVKKNIILVLYNSPISLSWGSCLLYFNFS